jgi:hypothetical protein
MRTILLTSRLCAALAAGILLNLRNAEAGVTINAFSPKFIDVQTAVSSANDGDTVIVPAGTAAWTSTLVLNKGITLIGATTTDSLAGTAEDNTIIQENVTRAAGGTPLIIVASVLGKSYRVSGFTFQPLSTTVNYNGMIRLAGNSQSVRLDHCHFQTLPSQAIYVSIVNAVVGVADHNVLEFNTGSMESFAIYHDGWGGYSNGDGAWAAPTAFGSSDFFFIEDNYLSNTRSPFYELLGCTDDLRGARWVFRYNHVYDIEIQTHGTEDGRFHGGRAHEIYNNDFHNKTAHGVGGLRSGCLVTHDNTWDGVQPTHGMVLDAYRAYFKWPACPFLGAPGDNPWDLNDTEGNGTNVPGHSPYLFDSGTAVAGSSGTQLIDNTKNWTPNQWVGFTAKRLSDNQVALIRSNTSNTLTVLRYPDSGGGAVWQAGDQYQIHKLLVAMDQPGRGQGDLITGTAPVNSKTGTPAWPHQALEPCYSWNDKYLSTGVSVNIQGAWSPTIQQGRDYYNNTPMPGYTPYTYPHPLVGGASPGATPSAPKNLRVSGP